MMKEILIEVNRIMKPFPVYAVGGCVRDFILGIEPKDYDFTTIATPDQIEKCIKSKSMRAFLTGKRFGTIGCKVKIEEKYYPIEITTFRTERYEPGNRKPEVNFVSSITEDLSRRDFTINSIAIRLVNNKLKIIDPFKGREDLKKELIRCVGNPKTRFKEDPLRILRAVRFATRFKYEIEEDTYKKMQQMAIHILDISKERWMQELDKILLSQNIKWGLPLLWDTNLFKYMIPELNLQLDYNQNSQYHNFKLHIHTIRVVDEIRKETDDLNMLWAGLLHDCGKIFTKTENKKGYSNYIGHEKIGAELVDKYAKYLKWSNERHEKVRYLVLNHLNDDCPLRKYDNIGKTKQEKSEKEGCPSQ